MNLNKFLFVFFMSCFLISYIFSFDNKELDNAVKILSDASSVIVNDGKKSFKKFSEYKNKWFNKENFVIVLDSNGKCLVNENVLKQNTFIVHNKVLEYTDFCNWIIKEVKLTNNSEGIIYYLSYFPGTINLEIKAFVYKKVIISDENNYWGVVATIKDNLFLEKALVEKELDIYSDILKQKGFASFPILRLKADAFFGKGNFFFIIDSKGEIIFDTGGELFPDFSKGKNITNYKDAMNKLYVKNLFFQSEMQKEGNITYFSLERNFKHAYIRNIFFKKLTINKEDILICYNVKFPKASYINIDEHQDNTIKTQLLSKEILENIKKFGFLEFKKQYLEKKIPSLSNVPFFIINGDNQDILFDTFDLSNKNKKNLKFIKNCQSKSIWKNIKLVLDNNGDEGWVCLSALNKQNEFSLIKKKDVFVYIIRIVLDNTTYIVCVPSNLKNIKKEFIEENSEILKQLFIKENKKNTNILDIKELLLNVVLNTTRFFIIDMSGNIVMDSQILNLDLIDNVMNSKDIHGNYFFRKILMNLKNNDNGWENFDIKTLEGEIKEKSFYFNKVDIDNKKYVIVTESNLNI